MPIATLPDPQALRDIKTVLRYNPRTGLFTSIAKRNGARGVGRRAGTILKNGYVNICVAQKHYYAHRLAWWWVFGVWPDKNIDHVNGKRADNRIANLRLLDPSPNGAWRKGLNKNNTSGFKGIHLHKASGLWMTRVKVMRQTKLVGYFKTKAEAARAYDAAAVEEFGIYAKTNKMMGLL